MPCLNFCSFYKRLECLWRISNWLNRQILNDKITIFKIGLGMIWLESQSKFNLLSSLNLSLRWLYPIMLRVILQSDFVWIFVFEDWPMKRDKDWWEVLNFNHSLSNGCGVGIGKLQWWKCIDFKIYRSSINLNYLNVEHSTVSCNLKTFRCVVVTSQDQIFSCLSLLVWRKWNINIDGIPSMQVELSGS